MNTGTDLRKLGGRLRGSCRYRTRCPAFLTKIEINFQVRQKQVRPRFCSRAGCARNSLLRRGFRAPENVYFGDLTWKNDFQTDKNENYKCQFTRNFFLRSRLQNCKSMFFFSFFAKYSIFLCLPRSYRHPPRGRRRIAARSSRRRSASSSFESPGIYECNLYFKLDLK